MMVRYHHNGEDFFLAAAVELEIKRLEHDLAECYKLSGADPDGDEDWRLAKYAVQEVTRMREEWDKADEDLEDIRIIVDKMPDAEKAVIAIRAILK